MTSAVIYSVLSSMHITYLHQTVFVVGIFVASESLIKDNCDGHCCHS